MRLQTTCATPRTCTKTHLSSLLLFISLIMIGAATDDHSAGSLPIAMNTRMWASAQRDGRPAEYRLRLLLNAAKFG